MIHEPRRHRDRGRPGHRPDRGGTYPGGRRHGRSGIAIPVCSIGPRGEIGQADRVHIAAVEIGDLAAVENATTAVAQRFGNIDVPINKAATVAPNTSTWTYRPDAVRDVVHVGLVGTFHYCRTIVPCTIQRDHGRIVNLSSIGGEEGNPNAVASSSTKAGVIAPTKSLGRDLADIIISVNGVTPALAKSAMALSQAPEHLAYILAKLPRGRMLELSEPVAMICWLASEESPIAALRCLGWPRPS